MGARKDPSSGSEIPWWLAGEETCQFCLQQFAYEMEYRCAACDRSVCAECVVVIRRTQEVFCSECIEAEEEA